MIYISELIKKQYKVQIYVKFFKRPIFASQVRPCVQEERIVSETLREDIKFRVIQEQREIIVFTQC